MYRSMLFVPAANAKAMAKAPSLAADAIIIDLEDGLAPEQKDAGRAAVIRFLRENKESKTPVLVRINSGPEAVQRADVCAITSEGPVVIVVPKVENWLVLQELTKQMKSLLHGTGKAIPALWAMIETPLGLRNVDQIARLHQEVGLKGLIVGTNDLIAGLRCANDPGRGSLLPYLAQIVLAARVWGIPVIDGVYNNFSDPKGFVREAAQGKALGFDGKSLIHPSQVEPANTAFGPSSDQVKQAQAIVHAYSYKKNAGKGAINVNGQMVERLHLEAAKELLAQLDKEKG